MQATEASSVPLWKPIMVNLQPILLQRIKWHVVVKVKPCPLWHAMIRCAPLESAGLYHGTSVLVAVSATTVLATEE